MNLTTKVGFLAGTTAITLTGTALAATPISEYRTCRPALNAAESKDRRVVCTAECRLAY